MGLHVVTANVNGIRSALRRGGLEWIAESGADVACLQEVRATPNVLGEALGAGGLADWHLAHAPSIRTGHAGVAILSRLPLSDVSTSIGGGEFDEQGRWVEATIAAPVGGLIRVASVYVHTGEAEGPRLHEKDRFLTAMGAWLAKRAGEPALLCGDLNVAHHPNDLKNWRARGAKAGFLPSERAHLTGWYAPVPDGLGWTDLGRHFAGDRPGPYTWWSWRGRGFDTDGGWRIDCILASPSMAARASDCVVHKAPTYAQRWSDHAAVSATFA